MNARSALAVFRFEWSRSLTFSRIFAWGLLTLFPAGLLAVVRFQTYRLPEIEVWGMIIFMLVPGVVCLLGLLLWATPVIFAELEGKSWIFLAVRPAGRTSLVLGKYLAALSWTLLSGWTAVTLALLVALVDETPFDVLEGLRLWSVLMLLVGLSCLAYGALYTLLGVLFYRRSMVLAVGYTLVFEFLVAFIPAVINKLTVQYRLRCLLWRMMEWRVPANTRTIVGDEPLWLHIVVLLAMTLGMLAVALVVVRRREFAIADET